MKKSELKEMIKAAMLNETLPNMDQDDMADAILNTLGAHYAFEALIKALSSDDAQLYLSSIIQDYNIKMDNPVDDIPGFEGTMDDLDALSIREEEEEDVEDTPEEDVEDTSEEDVEDTPEEDIEATADNEYKLTGEEKDIQDSLEKALEAAKALGDKKLENQIGNTITFFTRTHVVGKGEVAELKEILSLQKRAGIITETQYKEKLNEFNMDQFSIENKILVPRRSKFGNNPTSSPKASFEDKWNNVPAANKEILKKSTGKEPIEIMASSKGMNLVITKGSDGKFYRYEYTQAENPGKPDGPFNTIEDAKK